MNAFAPTDRSRVKRRPQRAAYDEAAVFAVLDAGLLAHVGYVIDGQPFVTPTSYWREGRSLYWHGAAASRMLASVADAPVCLTVSFLDGLIVGRSGKAHSVNYRACMAFGRARLIGDLDAKRAAMRAFIERIYPGRWETLRPIADAELREIALVGMTIEEASVKQRADGAADLPADAGWNEAWSGVLPVEQRIGQAQSAAFGRGGAPTPDLAHLAPGARLDEALRAAAAYGLPVSA